MFAARIAALAGVRSSGRIVADLNRWIHSTSENNRKVLRVGCSIQAIEHK